MGMLTIGTLGRDKGVAVLWHGTEKVQKRGVPESNGLFGGDAEALRGARSGTLPIA